MNRIKYFVFFFISTYFLQAQDSLSLSIDDAIKYALENNLNKKLALKEVEIAEQKIKETIGIGLPQISGNANYTNNIKQPVSVIPGELFGGAPGTFSTVTFGTKQNMSAGLYLNQLLFDGSYLVGLESTRAFKKISELGVEKTEYELKEAVLITYSAAIISMESINIIKKNILNINKNLYNVTEIYKVGLGEEQAVDQMQYNKSSLEISLKNAENVLANIKIGLNYLLNLPLDTKVNLSTNFQTLLETNHKLLIDTENIDVSNHIDVLLADNQIITNKLSLKYEKSKYWPTLSTSLSSNYSAFSNSFDFFNQQWFNSTIWGISLNVPIFSGFQKKARTQQAKINLDKSEINKQLLEYSLQKEIKENINLYNNSLLMLEQANTLIALSEKIYNKESIKFYEGIGTNTDLIVAENQKYQAQSQYIQSVHNLIETHIKLNKSLGKL